jgi:hypothetical protein
LIQARWSRFLELWEEAAEAERTQLLPLLIDRLDMIEKEREKSRLIFLPTHSVLSSDSNIS